MARTETAIAKTVATVDVNPTLQVNIAHVIVSLKEHVVEVDDVR